MYPNQRYRGDGETEEMSRGHVIPIGRDNAGDCSITSRDVPRGPEMDLGCHGYDMIAADGHCNVHGRYPHSQGCLNYGPLGYAGPFM